MAEYATSIEIEATPAEVFEYLVTDAGMTAWMGLHATLDPRPGGRFAVDIAGHAIRGEYLEVDQARRVVVSWGVAGSPDLPPRHLDGRVHAHADGKWDSRRTCALGFTR